MKRSYTTAFDACLDRCQPGQPQLRPVPAVRPVRLRAVLLALALLYAAGWLLAGLLAWAFSYLPS